MIGIGFKILTHTPVPTLPQVPDEAHQLRVQCWRQGLCPSPFFRTLVDFNLEQIMPMLMFHPD